MAKRSKKGKSKKTSKIKKSTRPTKLTKPSKIRKKSSGAGSDNFRYYNQTKSAVRDYLRSKGIVYTGKELSDYTSNIYNQIKKKSEIKGKGKAFLDKAFENIEVFVEQHFYQPPFANKVEVFDWWYITDEVNLLSAMSYVIIDSSEVLPSTSPNVYYEGRANGWNFLANAFNFEVNGILQRKSTKGAYFKYIKIFFRSDEKEKEFFYFILVPDDSPLTDDEQDYSSEEVLEFVTTNYIFDIEAIFDRIPFKTPVSSFKISKPSKGKQVKVGKGAKKATEPEKPKEKTITKEEKKAMNKKIIKRMLSGLTKKEFNDIRRELFSKKKKK